MGERGFWALDDACAVWLAYLVEEIARQGADIDPWLGRSAEQWRIAAAVTDNGADGARQTARCSGNSVALELVDPHAM